MTELVFFLEEQSAEELLKGLLPKVLPEGVIFRCIVFEGKQDMEKQLTRRIRGYRAPNALFIVLRDQDTGDCLAVKKKLAVLCRQAKCDRVLIRIACRELESWYLADLKAVEKGLSCDKLAEQQLNKKYRAPDYLHSPKQELMRLTKNHYQEIGGSRAIGPHLEPDNTRSRSFAVFIAGIRNLASANSGDNTG